MRLNDKTVRLSKRDLNEIINSGGIGHWKKINSGNRQMVVLETTQNHDNSVVFVGLTFSDVWPTRNRTLVNMRWSTAGWRERRNGDVTNNQKPAPVVLRFCFLSRQSVRSLHVLKAQRDTGAKLVRSQCDISAWRVQPWRNQNTKRVRTAWEDISAVQRWQVWAKRKKVCQDANRRLSV